MKKLLSFIIVSIMLLSCFAMTFSAEAERKFGDANGDGKINLSDVSIIMKYIAKWDLGSEREKLILMNGDVNEDERVNLSDTSRILKAILFVKPTPTY